MFGFEVVRSPVGPTGTANDLSEKVFNSIRMVAEEKTILPFSSSRSEAIDLLRGLVMVIMLLDHTRDFFHRGALLYDPTDLAKTNVAVFLTRWITHFCAPVFVFLAGTSIYLQLARGKSKPALAKFLLTRGLWLIILEFTIVRFGYLYHFDYSFFGTMQVIWVIGISMILMAGLIYLPQAALALLGFAFVALHNLLDCVKVQGWDQAKEIVPSVMDKLWIILHQNGEFPIWGNNSPSIYVNYPLLPWLGVMLVGYVFGCVYLLPTARRRQILIKIGVGVTAAFIILRALNMYGDPSPWAVQTNAVFTVLSFLNTTKYGPSLLFLLMTLGPAILALAWFARAEQGRIGKALILLGHVPLFFYLMQWFTAHSLAIVAHLLAGKSAAWLLGNWSETTPLDAGFDLWMTYAGWGVGMLILYPLCRWFAGVKQRRREWWLRYL